MSLLNIRPSSLYISLAAVGAAGISLYLYATPAQKSQLQLREDMRAVTGDYKLWSGEYPNAHTNSNAEDVGGGLTQLNQDWDTFVKKDSSPTVPRTGSMTATQPAPNTRPIYTTPTDKPYTPLVVAPTEKQPYKAPGLQDAPPESDTEKIKKYGNAVGEVIQTAVRGMGDQNSMLMAFVTDTSKKAPVESLADKYRTLATELDTINHIVPFTKNAAQLADGYRAVAAGLDTLALATKDTVYDQLLTYNSKVETFAEAFVPYASLFSALGVTFSPDEPGGIFTPAVSAM